MLLSHGTLFLRELGSVHGTSINGRKIGRVGVPWCPQEVDDGDNISFGELKLTVNIKRIQKLPEKKAAKPLATKVVRLRVQTYVRQPGIRTITFTENQLICVGRAKVDEPATLTNGRFIGTGISFVQAHMWLSKNKLYIRSKSTTFPTTVNGNQVTLPTEIQHNDEIVLGFANRYQVKFHVLFKDTPSPAARSLPQLIILRARNLGQNFSMRTIPFDACNNILIGAATPNQPDTTTNGLFQCSRLSPQHAVFNYNNGRLYLTDKGSDTGTFITINGKQTALRENVPIELVNDGAIVQFGSSTNKNFIRAYCNLAQTTDTRDLSSQFLKCHLTDCNRTFDSQFNLNRHINV